MLHKAVVSTNSLHVCLSTTEEAGLGFRKENNRVPSGREQGSPSPFLVS